MGVQALTHSRARRHATQTQGAHEESVAAWTWGFAKVLDGVKVILAQTQQAQVAFEDSAVGDTGANRKSRIDYGIDIDALEIFADQCQPGVGAEVVGQFFDNKVGHLELTFRVTQVGG
jgi:hypothetical protein